MEYWLVLGAMIAVATGLLALVVTSPQKVQGPEARPAQGRRGDVAAYLDGRMGLLPAAAIRRAGRA